MKKDYYLDIKQLDEEGEFEGFASVTSVVDAGRDVVEPGAFEKSLMQRGVDRIKLLWQHNPGELLGKFIEIKETARGLFVRGKLDLNVEKAREALSLIKTGALDGLSIGFKTIKSEDDEVSGIRKLLEVDLWEVSLVTFPMNDLSRITAVKSLPLLRNEDGTPDTKCPWDSAIAEINVKTLDPEIECPFGDVVDGKLMAIPRGVFAAAGALASDRDMPEEQKAATREVIEGYYKAMDMESPFEKGLGPNELGRMTIKQIKTYMRGHGFSGSGAEYLSHMIGKGIKSLSDSGTNSPSDSGPGSLEQLRDELKQKTGG